MRNLPSRAALSEIPHPLSPVFYVLSEQRNQRCLPLAELPIAN